jgi:GAF domain-containing protein
MLVLALHIQQKPAGLLALAHGHEAVAWEGDTQLLLKLIGTSLASGLERLAMKGQLVELSERAEE